MKNKIKNFLKYIISIIHFIFIRIGLSHLYLRFLIHNKAFNSCRSLYINFKYVSKKNIDYISSKNIFKKYKILMQEDIANSENLLIVFQTQNITTTPAVKNFSQKSKVHFVPVNLNVCKFNKATITFKSDIIRIDNSCYWYKFHSPLMYKTIPSDADLIAIKDGNLFLDKEIFDNKKLDKAVSLIGARDESWSHFLVQYYPKLEILKKYLHDVNITLVISEKLDRNSKELINFTMPQAWKIYVLKDGYSIKCEELYYVDNTSWLTDHSESLILGDTMIYEESFKIIKNMVDNFRLNHSQPKEKNRRIYLRRSGKHRGLINSNEVDKLLEEFDFEVINGHE